MPSADAQDLASGMAGVALNPGLIDSEVLRSYFGGSASRWPSARERVKATEPFRLEPGPSDNRKSSTVAQAREASNFLRFFL